MSRLDDPVPLSDRYAVGQPTPAEVAYAHGYDAYIDADKLAAACHTSAPRVPNPTLYRAHTQHWNSFARGWRTARAFLLRERLEAAEGATE